MAVTDSGSAAPAAGSAEIGSGFAGPVAVTFVVADFELVLPAARAVEAGSAPGAIAAEHAVAVGFALAAIAAVRVVAAGFVSAAIVERAVAAGSALSEGAAEHAVVAGSEPDAPVVADAGVESAEALTQGPSPHHAPALQTQEP